MTLSYFSHVEKVTTREDPRDDPDYLEPPKPREVELTRDPQLGFGFVAGSEKPVIVRFVTEGRFPKRSCKDLSESVIISAENRMLSFKRETCNSSIIRMRY